MRKQYFISTIRTWLILITLQTNAQDVKTNSRDLLKNSVAAIKARSALWNSAYNSRDSLTFYTLFDSLAILSSGGGRWIPGSPSQKIRKKITRPVSRITTNTSKDEETPYTREVKE